MCCGRKVSEFGGTEGIEKVTDNCSPQNFRLYSEQTPISILILESSLLFVVVQERKASKENPDE